MDWLENPYLRAHLTYTADTEPPEIMQTWAAISAASACMGRHVWLPFGVADLFANMFVLLVGPPATRKSTAVKLATKLVKQHTFVQFAPDDTAGQRQGLIAAMMEKDEEDEEDEKAETDSIEFVDALTVERLNGTQLNVGNVDAHTLYIAASEFGAFMGQNSTEMTRFLIKMWDGEDYVYKLTSSVRELRHPLLGMVGGTTTTDIAKILPSEAIGQGFMSRVILVFAPGRLKSIARPSLDLTVAPQLAKVLHWLYYEMQGPMTESADAAKLLDKLYNTELKMPDNRFMYYIERRQTHLLKLSMVLAATRFSREIAVADVAEANEILQVTEAAMPDALGEYGLSPLAQAKQRMLEFIQHSGLPVPQIQLWAMMSRDMRMTDFTQCLNGLLSANKIQQVHSERHGPCFIYNDAKPAILDALAEEELPDERDQRITNAFSHAANG